MANLVNRWNKNGKVAVCEPMMLKQMEAAGYTYTECPTDVVEKVEAVEEVKVPRKTRKVKTKVEKEEDAKALKDARDAQVKAEEAARIEAAKAAKEVAVKAGPDIVL